MTPLEFMLSPTIWLGGEDKAKLSVWFGLNFVARAVTVRVDEVLVAEPYWLDTITR